MITLFTLSNIWLIISLILDSARQRKNTHPDPDSFDWVTLGILQGVIVWVSMILVVCLFFLP